MWSPTQQIRLLAQSLRTGRSVELPKDPESALSLLLPMVFANQYKSIGDLLNNSTFNVNYSYGRAQRTLMHIAANCGHWECINVLLAHGGDPNIQDISGSTALHLAAKNGQKRCVEKLLEHGGDPNLPGNDGATTIHWLATNGRHEILKSVLTRTHQLNVLDYHGHTPLHAAARNGHVKAMECLINDGADLNFANQQGVTPMHAACSTGQRDAIALLIEKHASTLPDSSGVTPLDLCMQGGYGVASEILLKSGEKNLNVFLNKAVYNLDIDFSKVTECFSYLFTTDMFVTLHNKISAVLCDCGFQLISLSSDYKRLVESLDRAKQIFLAMIKHVSKSTDTTLTRKKVYEDNLSSLTPLWNALDDWLALLEKDANAHMEKIAENEHTEETLIVKMSERLCALIHTMHACTISLQKNILFVFSSEQLLSIFLSHIKSQPFEIRYNWFYENLDQHSVTAISVAEATVFKVDRQKIFQDSCSAFNDMDVRNVKQHFSVQFKDEEGMGDGVMREWLSLLSSEIMNPQYGLFSPSADGCSFQPNRHSAINPDHLVYFKFAGKILGLALYRGQFVNVTFTSSFYKHLLGIKVNYMDVESIDPEYAKNLQWILDNDITDLGLELSFVVETDVFGVMQELELKKNGSKILVTQENKEEYVQLVTELRMTRAIQPQIDAFKEGFNEFIPESLLQIFDVDELKTMLSGSSKLDVEYLKSLTSYSGCYDENHQVIKWLWQCVENMDDEEQTSLLLFVTGCSRLPPPFLTHHNTKFVVSHEPGSEEKLPTASTCMNMLKLPEYGSYETLQQKLFIAVKCGHAGYSFI